MGCEPLGFLFVVVVVVVMKGGSAFAALSSFRVVIKGEQSRIIRYRENT